jgi:hypothetical protein
MKLNGIIHYLKYATTQTHSFKELMEAKCSNERPYGAMVL